MEHKLNSTGLLREPFLRVFMSAIFKLQPNPVFKADVAIPRAGEEDGVLNFTFKHRPIKELAELEDIDEKAKADAQGENKEADNVETTENKD